MPDPNIQKTQENGIPQEPEKIALKSRGGKILAIIAIILALAAIGWFFVWKKNTGSKPANLAGQIRNIFSPPTGTISTFKPPVPGANFSTSSPFNAIQQQPAPAPSSGIKNSGQPNSVSPRGPKVSGAYVYKNDALKFQITLPAGWVAKEQGNKIFFSNVAGAKQQQGYIEVYDNTDNETLGSLTIIFQNSGSVRQVSRTTAAGYDALKFITYNPADSGLAIIQNNKIYFLRGGLSDSGTAAGFRATVKPQNPNPVSQNSNNHNAPVSGNSNIGQSHSNTYPNSDIIYY